MRDFQPAGRAPVLLGSLPGRLLKKMQCTDHCLPRYVAVRRCHRTELIFSSVSFFFACSCPAGTCAEHLETQGSVSWQSHVALDDRAARLRTAADVLQYYAQEEAPLGRCQGCKEIR